MSYTPDPEKLKKAFLGPVETMEDLKYLFVKSFKNMFPATDRDGKLQRYLRQDLQQWAKDAKDKGENFFYADPVDPANPNGELKLAEPKYKYKMVRQLTEEEFNNLFGTV